MYDYTIVGAGFFGAVCAHELNKLGKKVLVIDKRGHIAGNAYTEDCNGIQMHKYGAHIFHTNDKIIWDYVNSFCEFNRFTNSPMANFKGKLYNLPFNMNTFYQLWGTITPAEAIAKIKEQKEGFVLDLNGEPSNLEEMAISLVGSDIYNILIKGYTEKQWGRKATELPSFIIKRIPVRFTFDNNYFSDKYQGIPIGGYTKLIQKMLSGVEVKLNYDYFEHKENIQQNTKKLIYTGPIDRYYDYKYGELEYRSLDFKTEKLDIENYQGCAVINFTDAETPFTRIIEHKHFDYVDTDFTLITKEYPQNWDRSKEAYYPVNNEKNMHVYKQYAKLVKQEVDVIFGGRLAEYKYYDMHQVIRSALHTIQKITALS